MIETSQVVSWVKQLAEMREELATAEERGKEYLAQCKADVEQDLQPRRDAIAKLNEMLTIFLKEENGGKKYAIPGLGTVYLTNRTTPKIVDETVLAQEIQARNPLAYTAMQITSIDRSKAQKFANGILKETGEAIPGIEVTHTEAVSFRQQEA